MEGWKIEYIEIGKNNFRRLTNHELSMKSEVRDFIAVV